MVHRKWKETKQHPSMLPGPAVPGYCLVSFHFLWAILCPQAVGYCRFSQKKVKKAVKAVIRERGRGRFTWRAKTKSNKPRLSKFSS